MDFVIENWHLILFGGVSLGALIWEALSRKKPTTERMYKILLLILATYGVAWVTQEYRHNREQRGDVDFFLAQLTNEAHNEFARSVLHEYRSKLLRFKQESLEAKSEAELRYHLSAALKNTKRAATFLDHYVLVWAEGRGMTAEEDMPAVRRGVELTRIFVISESVARNRQSLQQALKVMRNLHELGVRVKYVFQRDLYNHPEYSRYSDVDYASFNDEVLAKIAAHSSPIEPAKYGVLMWGREDIRSENPMSWITSLGVLHDYPSDEALLKGPFAY